MATEEAPLAAVEEPIPPDLAPLLEGILPVHETSDMVLVVRIRRIIEENLTEAARLVLARMVMWYHEKLPETHQVFWSENHFIMSSSSEFLLRQLVGLPVEPPLERRVLSYLDMKLSIGMAEFLSPVYYPFTITALLNLYDYSHSPVVKAKAQALLDVISLQVLSVTLPDGSFISPSGRSYARHRERTTEHHLSVYLQYLIQRRNLEPAPGEPEMALREACRTTTYLPNESAYRNFREPVVDTELSLSPAWRQLYDYLQLHRDQMTLEERVSALWSHGAYFHPQAMLDILSFMDRNGLWKHPHFKAAAPLRRMLCCCPRMLLGCVLSGLASSCLVRPFALGALLTGASLAVYKEGKVLLASLTGGYNAGLPAFQQWPWTVNLAGAAIWCSFGPVGTGGLGSLGNAHAASELSTARVIPLMQQRGNKLSALYLSATCVQAIWNRSLRPRVRWRTEDFDEHGTLLLHAPPPHASKLLRCVGRQAAGGSKPLVWKWARKDSAVMAQTVVGLEVLVVVRDLATAGMASVQDFLDELTREHGPQPAGSAGDGRI